MGIQGDYLREWIFARVGILICQLPPESVMHIQVEYG